MVHGLEGEYWGRVDFVYLDIENPNNYQALRSRFGNVNTIPRFFILDADGNILSDWTGVETSSRTREKLDFVVQNYSTGVVQVGVEPIDHAYQKINHALSWTYIILSYLQ